MLFRTTCPSVARLNFGTVHPPAKQLGGVGRVHFVAFAPAPGAGSPSYVTALAETSRVTSLAAGRNFALHACDAS